MKKKFTQEFLHSVLDYDPETGSLVWKYRPICGFAGWNEKYAEKEAGCLDNYGYRIVTVLHKPYKAHRLIWFYVTGEWPPEEIDHKDNDESNNAWNNLRLANAFENKRNRRAMPSNKSGYKGVSFIKSEKVWRAGITVNNKTLCVGSYKTAEEAYKAYCKAAKKYHGEFARVA